MNRVKVPKEIDAPPQIAIFDMDEFFTLFFVFTIGVITGHIILFSLLLWPTYIGFRHMKAAQSRGSVPHTLYWFGLLPGKCRPDNGQDREFTGG